MSTLARLRLARDSQVTVANLVDELLRRCGDCEVGIDSSFDTGGPLTLAGLHAEVASIDAFLRHTVGLRPGQLVAVYRTNDHLCFRWFLAIIRAGGIAVPLNPLLSLGEVRRILTESGADILVTDTAIFSRKIGDRGLLPVQCWIQADNQEETMDGFLRAGQSLERAGRSQEIDPPTTIDPAATIAIFHTSGTSGFPKGAALSSRALLGARATVALARLVLGPKDLALVALPWSHIMAVSIALYGLMAGIRGCFLEHFDLGPALDLIERFKVTAVFGVPAIFTRLVNSHPDPERLRTVRVWLSASDHLPLAVREQMRAYGALIRLPWRRRIPPVVLNGYGMVELGGLAMMGVELSFLPGSGDLCFPMPPFQIRVADDAGRHLHAGMTGECQIRRRGLEPHYWKSGGDDSDGLLTHDGWLRTGDLATRNRLGMIRLVGRMKDVIKSGGYSVYVREVEEAVLAHPAVARAAAFGLPHAEKGQIPAVAVELRSAGLVSEDELVTWCRERLAAYKAPRRIWIVESGELTQNTTGKMMRRVMQEHFATFSESVKPGA